MPAGRRSTCENCYHSALAEKRFVVNASAIASPSLASDYLEFGAWLRRTAGAHAAALKAAKFMTFFAELDLKWGVVPPYAELLAHFGAEGLRRVRLVMRWLQEERGLKRDKDAALEDSTRRNIERIIGGLPGDSEGAQLLRQFYDFLLTRGTAQLRSVQLALRPAATLLIDAAKAGKAMPDQVCLDSYLARSPGQRNAISGFVGFLSRRTGTTLQLPQRGAMTTARTAQLERQLQEMMRNPESSPEFKWRWIVIAARLFHGVVLPRQQPHDWSVVPAVDGALSLEKDGRSFWIPPVPP